MTVITIDDVRAHSKQLGHKGDRYLQQLVDAAVRRSESVLGYSIQERYDEDVPADLKLALVWLAAHWAHGRTDFPASVNDIFNSYRNWWGVSVDDG